MLVQSSNPAFSLAHLESGSGIMYLGSYMGPISSDPQKWGINYFTVHDEKPENDPLAPGYFKNRSVMLTYSFQALPGSPTTIRLHCINDRKTNLITVINNLNEFLVVRNQARIYLQPGRLLTELLNYCASLVFRNMKLPDFAANICIANDIRYPVRISGDEGYKDLSLADIVIGLDQRLRLHPRMLEIRDRQSLEDVIAILHTPSKRSVFIDRSKTLAAAARVV